jgi:hypothetical protein
VTNGQQKENPNNYWWIQRALMVAMDKWVREGVAPPASKYPKLEDGTLVRASEVAFPQVPTVTSPRSLTAGGRGPNHRIAKDGATGAALPLLVPQVDQDGNERAGIRLPDIAVPLATYTGWNFRKPEIGGPNQLFPLMGSYIAFPATKSDRERIHDPRGSIEDRYASRDKYLALVQGTGASLVKDRYLLAEDLPQVIERAQQHWDLLTGKSGPATR